MIRIKDIVITTDMLNKIAEIDKFNGSWHSDELQLTPAELNSMKRIATIESVGSSNRIEGNQMTDDEIEKLFSHVDIKSFASRDEEEVAGYRDLIHTVFENYEDIPLTENYIKHLHKILLKHSAKDEHHRGEYKTHPNRVAACDTAGREIGIIFETADPYDTPRLMRELIQWTNDTFEDKFLHPLLTIGVFIVHFLAIHPFADGNGRLSRALTSLLMLKNGYGYMPYASMESIIEASKEAYYRALHDTQKTIWGNKTDYEPWLSFFVTALQKQKRSLEAKIQNLQQENFEELSSTAREILEVFAEKNELTLAELVEKINDNIKVLQKDADAIQKKAETIRKAVQKLVKKGYLKKLGTTRGASYRLKK